MAKPEDRLTWKDLEIGSIVTEPGSASRYQTGEWRSQRPSLNRKKCIKCGICYIFCPEGCITQNAEGYFETNLFYCKGCGICACECPTQAITIGQEE